MWTKDKVPHGGDQWNQTYRGDITGKWTSDDKGTCDRRQTALELIGDAKDKTFIDLGGGPLLGRALFERGAAGVLLVDISSEACALARELAPRMGVITDDVLHYLAEYGKVHFNVAVCMGLLDYMTPVEGLNAVLQINADELVINAAVMEGYLYQYEARVVIYDRHDILSSARMFGWEVAQEHNSGREHLFCKFRRVN